VPTSSDEDWLAAHHARRTSPIELLERIVRANGFVPVGFERIVVGQANEVHAVATEEEVDLVLRLAWRPDHKLATEAAAIEAVRARGIPAPEVLGRGALDGDGGASAYLLERRLPGVMLRDAGPAAPSVLEPLGELLAAVHAVPVTGVGNLDGDLRGSHASYGAWFVDVFLDDLLPTTVAALDDDPATVALVHTVAERFVANRSLLDAVPCGLAHGDLSPTNVLVHDGRISGIVDWEAVKGAPPANDLAWWSTVAPDDLPVEALVAGYQRVTPLGDDVATVFALARLRILAGMLGYAAGDGDVALFDRARRGLQRDLTDGEG
jgi:aminoglycoside phosphotransferase (APT) family kinase protein